MHRSHTYAPHTIRNCPINVQPIPYQIPYLSCCSHSVCAQIHPLTSKYAGKRHKRVSCNRTKSLALCPAVSTIGPDFPCKFKGFRLFPFAIPYSITYFQQKYHTHRPSQSHLCLFVGAFIYWSGGKRDFVCVGGSAMGGYALKTFRLTAKRGWSVCIIAYNDNGTQAARRLVQADGFGAVSRAVLFQTHFTFILCASRVTLSPCLYPSLSPSSLLSPILSVNLVFAGVTQGKT